MASSGKYSLLVLLGLPLLFALAHAATFQIVNRCSYTVWAGAVPGGGRRLNRGQSWTLNVSPGTKMARIWPRTGCSFDASGRGRCRTGDCGGVLQCRGFGQPPNTLAEYALNQFGNMDFYDISVIDGFNVPMEFSPANKADLEDASAAPANVKCQRIRCTADLIGQCPRELRAPGGCNNPCTVFKTDQYCCNSGSCGPTTYSRFFKTRCPDAYSYPKDDPTSTFTCPGGTNYRVVFCPLGSPRTPLNGTDHDLYHSSEEADSSMDSATGNLYVSSE